MEPPSDSGEAEWNRFRFCDDQSRERGGVLPRNVVTVWPEFEERLVGQPAGTCPTLCKQCSGDPLGDPHE